MAMALKQDVVAAQMALGICKPVDLVHLSAQTMGDHELETEVLGVFHSQSQIYMNLLESSKDEEILHRAAHSLKGAARGIGAFLLADEAEKLEHTPFAQKSLLRSELDKVLDYVGGIIN